MKTKDEFLLTYLVNIAAGQVGVSEIKDTNTGVMVRNYQRATNLKGTGWPWCAAFVCWCVKEWASRPDVMKRLGLESLNQVESWRPKTAAAWGFIPKNAFGEPRPKVLPPGTPAKLGDIICFTFSHVGIVSGDQLDTGIIPTIEGNTDPSGGREGGGVFARRDRKPKQVRNLIRLL